MAAVNLLVKVLHGCDGFTQPVSVGGLEDVERVVHCHAGDALPCVALLLQHVQPATDTVGLRTREQSKSSASCYDISGNEEKL